MARMYPPYLSKEVDSPGERTLFYKFKDDPETSDWIVLHSLYVADHPKRISGEIDFVVIIPNQGVLCLEVKAGNVSRKHGKWIYGSGANIKSSAFGPFRQASDAMHKIRNYVYEKNNYMKGIMFFSGVIFTARSFDEVSPEWHKWQFADRGTFSRKPISHICIDMLRNAHSYISTRESSVWYDNKKSRPSLQQAEDILEILRNDFEYVLNPEDVADDINESIKNYTKEQFKALDLFELNRRLLYKGPAGTGKTFLAMEAARRSVMSGKRTLLVCYNNLLGKWLVNNTASLHTDDTNKLFVGTFHKFLLSISGLASDSLRSPEFWNEELPELVIDRILSGIIKTPIFETLVIDEAQDLVTESFLDVLELILEGGIAGGNWAMFGDFERQAIYSSNTHITGLELEDIVKERSPYFTQYPLRVNCRNNETIAIGIELSCNLSPRYSGYIHSGSEVGIEAKFYNTNKEQKDVLREVVRYLEVKEKFSPDNIIILSSKRDEECAAKLLEEVDEEKKYMPLKSSAMKKDCIKYSTIHSFKGLESSVVIITDINRITGEKNEALLYIGMSRAKIRLVLLMHESCRENWKDTISKTFLGNQARSE